jgi:glycosyltransferase involved in cell wall biosynthesis
MSHPRRLCLVARIPGMAGPASFQRRLASGLASRGIEVSYSLSDHPYDAVLVNGGTRALVALARAKRHGIPILQRLDGINWIHRKVRTGARHYSRSELANMLMAWTRRRFADHIVYQSRFVEQWWNRERGAAPGPTSVVHNGVPLDRYHPEGPGRPPSDRIRLLVVEGNFAGGYEIGIHSAVLLRRGLAARADRDVELVIAGQVAEPIRRHWEAQAEGEIVWQGPVAPDQIPQLMRTGHLLYASDLNPACPNSVLEAMACGLPVVGFDTGALPEIVVGGAGRLAAYGGDPWSLDEPDAPALIREAEIVLGDRAGYAAAARTVAVSDFGLDRMIDGYLASLGWIEATSA